jgi:hypothetical protein
VGVRSAAAAGLYEILDHVTALDFEAFSAERLWAM